MSHPNTVRGLSELVVVTSNVEIDAPRYAKAAQGVATTQGDDLAIETPGGFRITLTSLTRYRARYGELCVEADGRESFFGSIVIDAPDLTRIHGLASSIPDLRIAAAQDSLAVFLPFLNTLLEFRKPLR